MWPQFVIPFDIGRQILAESSKSEWNEDAPGVFVLEGSDEPLDDRDAPVFAHRAEPGFDLLSFAPSLEPVAEAWRAFVGDKMLRSRFHGVNDADEE